MLSYTNVTATVALCLALGGTSYAATTLTSADVRNGSVRGGDVRNASLGGRDVAGLAGGDVRDGSLTTSALGDGSLQGADFAGVLPAGPAGPPGPAGPVGATDVVARRAAEVPLKIGDQRIAIASCEPGEIAVGGGAAHSGTKDDLASITLSEPVAADGSPLEEAEPAGGWRARGQNTLFSTVDVTMRVHVLCARP